MPVQVLPVVPEGMIPQYVVGTAMCPACRRDDVAVVNDGGPGGDTKNNYFENHSPRGGDELCRLSRAMLNDCE